MKSIVTQRFINCHDKLKEENRIRSSRQFAISLDYLPQSLSEILKGRRDVTIELIRKAVEEYQLNPVYLYTGEGPMFMTEEDHKSFRVLTIVTNAQEDERIVHVPVPAQAGYAGEQVDPTFIQDLPTFTLPDYKYKVGTHRSFDVSGDSMEPTLFEGDKVICSFLEPTLWESAIKDNYVYVIITRADVMVKRVNNLLRSEKQLEILSDNAFYEPNRIDLGDIREVWYVRAKISPFLPSPQNIRNYLLDEIRELKQTIAAQGKLLSNLNDSVEKIMDNGQKKD
ncbi:S24 family peptidase [Flavilitoribacter nigricans]|uniref:Peptidase S24 n=1 Tax=Flavilitoribacter nigricans (strain ATCC 23147 / DSM 23189 / NBRC 102662 / NCIMB 1420 / SS-2) TaxID=1122177 RepID=A0A2D0NGL5_FLAN2|nr:S24 family peptidase [Flavilitoribacter nigricans]PHN07526.1 peptidase S24 [Flavilitoribacter nigricans DSM 23189 = NBRC 102662]